MAGKELTLTEIERSLPDQWVLVEETAWDARGNPVRGIVRAHGRNRDALREPLHQIRRKRPQSKTFIFYTGDKIPEDLTVVL